jgi:peptide-methionine (S)-S-oxide reductase
MENNTIQTAVFAGGCFWCTEAIFQNLRGVKSVVSGYTGGNVENPDYEAVSSGSTGHAEAIKIEFDPTQISYTDLLEVFFATHDPTTYSTSGKTSRTL